MRLILVLAVAAIPLLAQTDPTQSADRDALLKPVLDQMKAHQYAEAYAACGPALAKYPADLTVLSQCAVAASASHQPQPAADLFTRALAQRPAQPWPLRLSRMQAYAALGQWDDFDRGLEELRAAKKAGIDPQLAGSGGFGIDEFVVNGETISTVFFPTMSSRYHTLYRFYLPRSTVNTAPQQAATNTPGAADACKNPKFQPYIDLESDDVDQATFQKAHPDLAAKGGREYSLDTYPAPCSQGLVRFYDGEPKYETLRADLIKTLSKAR